MKSPLCCCLHNLWNSLLDHLRQAKLIGNFKSLLKLLFLSKLSMHEFYIQIYLYFLTFCLIFMILYVYYFYLLGF